MKGERERPGEARGEIVFRDGQFYACVTGNNNHVFQINATSQGELEGILAEIRDGRKAVEEAPNAVPLPTLILRIAVTAPKGASGLNAPPREWRVTCRRPENAKSTGAARSIASPITAELAGQLSTFYGKACAPVEKAEERVSLERAAAGIGEALAGVLPESERERLIELGRAEGPPPFLVIESAEDPVLMLPWELLRLDGGWAVRDGRLDVARCVPNRRAGRLQAPKGPVGVYVNVCAPEGPGVAQLNHEKESFRIMRALAEHPGVRVNEMGELGDLVKTICSDEPPGIVHFSGHGGSGILLFEDEFGGPDEVTVSRLVRALRADRVERWPGLIYLACCHGQDPSGTGAGGVTSTAAMLHREGIPQVIAHFGPVGDEEATLAEGVFYGEIARGRRTREALRKARLAAGGASGGGTAYGDRTPFAWALMVLYHAGEDHPLSVPVARTTADLRNAPVRRHVEEELRAGGRTRIIRAGFIGRRRERHDLRRRLRDGRNVAVVQGLGGVGKSVYCLKALALYEELGYRPLTLWCSAVEDRPAQVSGLLQQLVEELSKHIKADLDKLLARAEKNADEPALRAAALLRALAEDREHTPPLALYLDNLESLMRKPDETHPAQDDPVEWASAECEALWRSVAGVARDYPERLALLASSRYRHDNDMPRAEVMGLGRMHESAVFRMLEWFSALGRLAPETRARLTPLLNGHGRAVEFLDGLVAEKITKWEARNYRLPEPARPDDIAKEWDRFVKPVLDDAMNQVNEDILFGVIWRKSLRPSDRRLLVRMTALRRPGDRQVVDALADAALEGDDLMRLRDMGLLEETTLEAGTERPAGAQLLEVAPLVAELARPLAPEWDKWRKEAYRLAGEFLDKRVEQSRRADDAFDAGLYLLEAGEADRGGARLLELAEYYQGREQMSLALLVLGPLEAAADSSPLSLRLRNMLFGLLGSCFANLGDLRKAEQHIRSALRYAEEMVVKEPDNPELQRDLSVSLNKIGDIQAAQGDLPGALGSFRRDMEIAEKLARLDPANTRWQADLIVSCVKVSEACDKKTRAGRDEARGALRRAVAIAERLEREGRFTHHTQKSWLQELRRRLAELGDA